MNMNHISEKTAGKRKLVVKKVANPVDDLSTTIDSEADIFVKNRPGFGKLSTAEIRKRADSYEQHILYLYLY